MASVCSCTTTTPPKEVAEPEPSYALEPGKDGAFADLEAAFIEKHGVPEIRFFAVGQQCRVSPSAVNADR